VQHKLESVRLAIEAKPFLLRAVRQRLRELGDEAGLTEPYDRFMWRRDARDFYDLAVFLSASLGEGAMARCKPEFKSMLADVMDVSSGQDADLLKTLVDALTEESHNVLMTAIVVLIFNLQNWVSLIHQGDIRNYAIASDVIDLYVRGNVVSLESASSIPFHASTASRICYVSARKRRSSASGIWSRNGPSLCRKATYCGESYPV
jgi:hypothetical protein